MALEISQTVTLDAEELVRSVRYDRNYEELLEFIKEIDLRVGEWDFTLKLCEHFAELKKEHEKEQEEDRRRRSNP